VGRRRKQSPFEDLIDVAALLPWWLSLVLAVASYFIFHHFAIMEIQVASGDKNIGAIFNKQLFKSFAVAFQYLVPAVFILGALASIFKEYDKRGKPG